MSGFLIILGIVCAIAGAMGYTLGGVPLLPIGIVALIIGVPWFWKTSATKKYLLTTSMRKDPGIAGHIEAIAKYGCYDGSTTSRQAAIDLLKSHFPQPNNPQTVELYRNTLTEPFYMPLVLSYAFAVGEYLHNPITSYSPAELHSKEANKKIFMMEVMFPDYTAFVYHNHPSNDARIVLAISSNIVSQYLT